MMKKLLALAMALVLILTVPLAALAEEYDLVNGSITVEARDDGKQYVTQEDYNIRDQEQTTETVIKQTDSKTTSTENTITIKADENQTAEVTISDVNIDVSGSKASVDEDTGSVIPGDAAISAEGEGNVTIELDGSNTVKSGEHSAGVGKNNEGSLTITDEDGDDSLNAAGGIYGAGIGGGGRQSVSDITIEGGNITATGGKLAAGIGGGAGERSYEDGASSFIEGSGSNITIAGDAQVKANGGWNGAGIGGGQYGSGSDITIEGDAQVEANGGKSGAGIGGGYEGSGSDLTIAGDAQVTAKGGSAAAGIGGGELGSGSSIKIEGNAQVDANGGKYGAGIGSGENSTGSDITIGGNAQVDAKGGNNGAGIGGGDSGNGTGITIKDDAQVNATGGGLGAGIGGGSIGNGSNITIEGNARVDATGGERAAGIGSGIYGSASDITIRGNAQVGVQGGNGSNMGGSGAGIGEGGILNPYDGPQAGREETPNTNDLTTGYIAYYAPGADKETTAPEKLLHKTASGTMETHEGSVTLKDTTEATCAKNAAFIYQCSCGETVTIEQPGTAPGHKVDSYTYDNNATCMADGTESGVCTRCQQIVKKTKAGTLDPNKHDFTDYISNNDATCTADGTKTAKCAYGCGAEDTQPDVGSKLAHKFDNYISNNDATCTADGTETAQCAYGCGTTDTQDIPGSKLPHEFKNYVYQNNATYDADGTQTAKCDRGCGASDTVTEPGSRIPLYRVVDAEGRNIPSQESLEGGILTITADQDEATLTGGLNALSILRQRGVTAITFVTNGAASTFDLAALTGSGTYALTHTGATATLTLNGWDTSNILR